ncbi:MAG: Rid family hydrolase [Bacteroidales bacterium]
MEYKVLLGKYSEIQLATFSPATNNGTNEYHALIKLKEVSHMNATEQVSLLKKAFEKLQEEIFPASLVWKRYFLSDPCNQYELFESPGQLMSLVGQAPLDGSKIAMWCYFIQEGQLAADDHLVTLSRPDYIHYYYYGLKDLSEGPYAQTIKLFNNLKESMALNSLNMAEHLIRTWVYVQAVDINYEGMVKARREVFEQEGLSENTHYVSSTGIEGRHYLPSSLVFMDAYVLEGLKEEQLRFLYAPEHLSPTQVYGVTFERGTTIEYGDRRHVFISGTASIDNRGRTLYSMDIQAQTERMFENVEALLSEAGAGFGDLAHVIVYLRDMADYGVVKSLVNTKLPEVPQVFVLAPVCRTQWLVEMECMAILPVSDNDFAPF